VRTPLPFHLATRLILDSISYSNPLPPWADALTVDYARREAVLAETADAYLAGKRPSPAFSILIPAKERTPRRWAVLSTNDQIILQACISTIADPLDEKLDRRTVWSYRKDPSLHRVQFIQSQFTSWSAFNGDALKRAQAHSSLLQFDLEETYKHITLDSLFGFLTPLLKDPEHRELLEILIRSAALPSAGLPLINDPLFYVGNAYLSLIDTIVRKHSPNFTRFVDDYRVFGSSLTELESMFGLISRDLRALGFPVNPRKIKLGSTEEFLDIFLKIKKEKSSSTSTYLAPAVLEDVLEPQQLLKLVSLVVTSPEEYMNDGFGRLALGAIRRLRRDSQIARQAGYNEISLDSYQELLWKDTSLVKRLVDLLELYSRKAGEEWRAVWLLYLAEDLNPSDNAKSSIVNALDTTVRAISEGANIPPLVRLWARRAWRSSLPPLDELDQLSYLDAGAFCCELSQ